MESWFLWTLFWVQDLSFDPFPGVRPPHRLYIGFTFYLPYIFENIWPHPKQ